MWEIASLASSFFKSDFSNEKTMGEGVIGRERNLSIQLESDIR